MVSVDFAAFVAAAMQFAGLYGLPALILIIFITLLIRGDIVLKREVTREQEATAKAEARADKWEKIGWAGVEGLKELAPVVAARKREEAPP